MEGVTPDILQFVETASTVVFLCLAVYAFFTGKIWPDNVVKDTLSRMEKLAQNSAKEAGREMGSEIRQAMSEILLQLEKHQNEMAERLAQQAVKMHDLEKTVGDLQRMMGDRRN